MEVFYTDKEKVFKCNVEVEGASMDDTFVRLILDFDGICYLFKGSISDSGKCKVKVPALKNSPKKSGKVTLEVIADSTLFESWEDDFLIKTVKAVSVKKNDDEDEDEKTAKPQVKVIKETEIKSFTDFYKEFIFEGKDRSKDFYNFKPSDKAVDILKENNYEIVNPVSKIFMYYLDKTVL